jgi:hypothetical protein
MIFEVELRIPGPPSEAFRREALARAPREGEHCCPQCGVDRFHLLDALCDPECWENRGLAVVILRGCQECRQLVGGVLAEAWKAMAVEANGTGGHLPESSDDAVEAATGPVQAALR